MEEAGLYWGTLTKTGVKLIEVMGKLNKENITGGYSSVNIKQFN